MDNTQNVLITAEIDKIVDTAYQSIQFEPMDRYTLMNYRSMLSTAISKMKNAGVIRSYSIDIQLTPSSPHDKIEGWITFTPVGVVQEIVMHFNMGKGGVGIDTHDYKFDQAMQGV